MRKVKQGKVQYQMGATWGVTYCVENATANKCTIKRVQHETGQNLKSKLKKV